MKIMLVKFHGARKAEVKMTQRNILSGYVNRQYSQNMSSEEEKSGKRHQFMLSVYLICTL